MKVSRNSNNLYGGTIGDLLKRIKPEAVVEPKPEAPTVAPKTPTASDLPLPDAGQALNRHRVSGAHHSSGAMGSTGWAKVEKSPLDQMLNRLKKPESNA